MPEWATNIAWGGGAILVGFFIMWALVSIYEKFEDLIKVIVAALLAGVIAAFVVFFIGFGLYELGAYVRSFF